MADETVGSPGDHLTIWEITRVGYGLLAASCAAVSGCASLAIGARDAFSKDTSCPPEQVTVTRRADVAPYTVLGAPGEQPSADLAAAPSRLRYWQQQLTHKEAQLNASCLVYEAAGCGAHTLLCCQHYVDDAGVEHDDVAVCSGSGPATATGRVVSTGVSTDDVEDPRLAWLRDAGTWTLDVARCDRPTEDVSGAGIYTVLVGRDGLRVGITISHDPVSGNGLMLRELGDSTRRPTPLSQRLNQLGQQLYANGVGGYRCAVLDADQKINATSAATVSATLRLECRTPAGATLSGSVTLHDCPYGSLPK